MNNLSVKKRIAVLRGGYDPAYDLSMKSGKAILESLSALGYTTKDIVISKKGEWLSQGFVRTPEQALLDVDSVFLSVHGICGENGAIQRILERLRMPYTGSNSFATSIATNNVFAKKQASNLGILVPRHMRISRDSVSNLTRISSSIMQLFGPQYIVKPIRSDPITSQIHVNNPVQLLSAIENGLTDNEEIVVEEKLEGVGASVGVIENYRDQKVYTLPEVETSNVYENYRFAPHFTYTPGRFSKNEKRQLADAAKNIHTALCLHDYSQVDFLVRDGDVYFLSLRTAPELAADSLFMQAGAAVGAMPMDIISHLVVNSERTSR